MTLWDEPGVVDEVESVWSAPIQVKGRRRLADTVAEVDVPRTSVLDAGCGTGLFYQELVPCLYEPRAYTGVDFSPSMLARARARAPEAAFVQADLHALPWPDAAFDLVFSFNVLGHLPSWQAALGELRRVARHAVLFSLWLTPNGAPNADHSTYRLADVERALGDILRRKWLFPEDGVFEVAA